MRLPLRTEREATAGGKAVVPKVNATLLIDLDCELAVVRMRSTAA